MDDVGKIEGWLLESGIQASNGAFSAWFDKDTGMNSFEYSEITGYGMTTLVFMDAVSSNRTAIENAEKAMAWLETRAMTKDGGILTRNYSRGEKRNEKFSFESGNVLAFDSGMVLNGLVNLYNRTGNEKALELARRVASFLLKNMFDGKKMHGIYSTTEGKNLPAGDRWSTQPGSYHAKLSIGLVGLSGITGEKRFEDVAVSLCEYALAKQAAGGRFVTNEVNGSTHLHPHCYSCEGLLFAGERLDRQEYVDAVERAVEWIFDNQAEDGGIRPFFEGSWNENQRSDILAQSMRLALALKAKGLLGSVPEQKLFALERRLLEFQDESGGFLYGSELDGQMRNCVNAWCTMFALQALAWKKGAKISLQGLV